MSVRTTMTLTDRMTGTLQKMMKAMNSTIRTMEQMHISSNRAGDMRSLQRATRVIQSARVAFDRLSASARLAFQNVGDVGDIFSGTSGGISAATSGVDKFFSKFVGFASNILSVKNLTEGFKKLASASDSYSNTNTRIANINDGSQTQAELQNKIYRASQRSLSSYNDMATTVAKLNAGDTFGSNDEAIRFSELMNKSFAASGASGQEKADSMKQITQAMASGGLQGDEFTSIAEKAPLLADAIADSLGKSTSELKQMSSDGEITADIIKNALFNAADEIEDKFSKTPKTFSDAMTVFKNYAQNAFEPIFKRFSEFVNSDAFGVLAGHAMVFVNLFVLGLSLVFDILERVYNGIVTFGDMLQNTWSLVGPIIVAVATSLGSYLTILTAYRGVLMIVAAYEAVRTFALGVLAAASMLATGATLAQTSAVWGLNTALLAFPGTWILIAFIAVIALVVTAMLMWAVQTAAVFGAIVGGVYWLGAVFYNVFIGILNINITVVEWLVNTWNKAIFFVQLAWIALNLMVRTVLDAIGNNIISVAEWIANTFNALVYGVQMAFYTMGTMVLKTVGGIADGIFNVINNALGGISNLINGAIGGVNKFIGLLNGVLDTDLSKIGTVDLKLSSGATNFGDTLQNLIKAPTKADKITLERKNTAGEYMNSVTMPTAPTNRQFERLDYKDLGTAYDKGNEIGKSLSLAGSEKLGVMADKLKGLAGSMNKDDDNSNSFPSSLTDDLVKSAPSESGLGKNADDNQKLNGGNIDKVGKIDDKIDLADEYLELFKDIAEGKAINNIVSLTPNLQVHNNFEDTTGSAMEKMLNKFGDLSNASGNVAKINDYVSQALNVPVRDDVEVSNEVREKVSASSLANNSKAVVQHIQSEPKFYFTGDIREKVDVHEVVKFITQGLKDEQNRSVEGVYG
ncbi:tape measure protein [Lysinibacillus sp. JNUCC-52]|uniref:tape measure protein n=1 Tax=Lysinibacillus sp. JNUCC-52 TaxID=2792480 RepID=UPI003081ACE2